MLCRYLERLNVDLVTRNVYFLMVCLLADVLVVQTARAQTVDTYINHVISARKVYDNRHELLSVIYFRQKGRQSYRSDSTFLQYDSVGQLASVLSFEFHNGLYRQQNDPLLFKRYGDEVFAAAYCLEIKDFQAGYLLTDYLLDLCNVTQAFLSEGGEIANFKKSTFVGDRQIITYRPIDNRFEGFSLIHQMYFDEEILHSVELTTKSNVLEKISYRYKTGTLSFQFSYRNAKPDKIFIQIHYLNRKTEHQLISFLYK